MKRFDFSGAGEYYHVLGAEDVGSIESLVGIDEVDVGGRVDDEVDLRLEVRVILLRQTHIVQTNIT